MKTIDILSIMSNEQKIELSVQCVGAEKSGVSVELFYGKLKDLPWGLVSPFFQNEIREAVLYNNLYSIVVKNGGTGVAGREDWGVYRG